MSTILEALKKSEQERKLNDLPTLSDMPPPQERSSLPLVLLIVICLLLLLVLAALAFQWWSAKNSVATYAQPITVVEPETVSEAAPEILDDAIVVNVVSYAEDPTQRFAIIDGKMVRENEFVRAGLQVEKIEPDAVLLNFRGERIKRTL